MASFSYRDAVVTVNGVDLSDHVKSATLTVTGAELDDTAMGDEYISRIGGLKDWSIEIEFIQDFAASEVDATVFPLLNTVTGVTIKPTSAATSATNPQYSGSVLVSQYPPLTGSVGDLAMSSVTWNGASGTLHRGTS